VTILTQLPVVDDHVIHPHPRRRTRFRTPGNRESWTAAIPFTMLPVL
jgi:hypothetical protein